MMGDMLTTNTKGPKLIWSIPRGDARATVVLFLCNELVWIQIQVIETRVDLHYLGQRRVLRSPLTPYRCF